MCSRICRQQLLCRHLHSYLSDVSGSIKKLKKEKAGLECEQDRLLTVNIDLAAEVKRLLQLDKDNREERKVSSGDQIFS